jgi:hypothetical protein
MALLLGSLPVRGVWRQRRVTSVVMRGYCDQKKGKEGQVIVVTSGKGLELPFHGPEEAHLFRWRGKDDYCC